MIDIIMATYNGERFIDTQITSIVNQSEQGWTLYIHDDGSADGTVQKIREWTERDKRIVFIDDGIKLYDAGRNFMHALKYSRGDLVCFADQDDLWFENKLSEMHKAFKESEKSPHLVYCDCHNWYFPEDKITKPRRFTYTGFEDFIFANGGLQGCAMMFNAPLRDILLRYTGENLRMHDHLASLAAFAFGKAEYMDIPLFLYRQHGDNVSGQKPMTNGKLWERILVKNRKIPVVYKASYDGTAGFYECFKDEIPADRRAVLEKYLAFPAMNAVRRFFAILFSRFSHGKGGHLMLVIKVLVRPFFGTLHVGL